MKGIETVPLTLSLENASDFSLAFFISGKFLL
jgi:hypothetical protein